MPDKNLEGQLEGLFSSAGSDEDGEEDSSLEGTLEDLLEAGSAAEVVADEAELGALLTGLEAEEELPPPAAARPPMVKELAAQRERILGILLTAMAIAGGVAVVALVFAALQHAERWGGYAPYFAIYLLLLLLTLVPGLDSTVKAGGLVGLIYAFGAVLLLQNGPFGGGVWLLLAAPLLSAILLNRQAGVVAAVASVVIYLAFLVASYRAWIPLPADRGNVEFLSLLGLGGGFGVTTVVLMVAQWMYSQSLVGLLVQAEGRQVAEERTQALVRRRTEELAAANALLQKRQLQLQTVIQISQAAAQESDPGQLMQAVVDLIRERLGLYYVGLFLTDESGQWLQLQAGTGEAGRVMCAGEYRLEIGGTSTSGQCVADDQARFAMNTGEDVALFGNPLLPESCSKLSLPLHLGGRTVGALNMQSRKHTTFSQQDIPVLQMLADQVAAIVENAQALSRIQARLEELQARHRRRVQEQWERFVPGHTVYEQALEDVPPLSEAVLLEVEQAMSRREVVVLSDGGDGNEQAALVAPLKLRDEVIGVLGLHDVGRGRRWSTEEINLIEDVANQMALALENARLLDETQRRAEQERLTAEISGRVRASTDIENILRTAIRELGRSLHASEGLIRLEVGEEADVPEGRGTEKS